MSAGTSTPVGVGAVVLATVALYVFAPQSVSIPLWRGSPSMTFVLVLSLVLSLVRSSTDAT